MGTASFKLDAKTIYSGVQAATGISQSTVQAALNGDKSAADMILKFKEESEIRANNAETLLTALQESMQHLDTVIQSEASFLKSASNTLTKAQKTVADVNQSDLKLQHTTKEVELESRLKLNAERQRHKIAINLLPEQYRTSEQIADINFRQRRYQLTQQLNEAKQNAETDKKQLTPRQQQLESIRQVGGSVANSGIVGGAKKILGWIFGG